MTTLASEEVSLTFSGRGIYLKILIMSRISKKEFALIRVLIVSKIVSRCGLVYSYLHRLLKSRFIQFHIIWAKWWCSHLFPNITEAMIFKTALCIMRPGLIIFPTFSNRTDSTARNSSRIFISINVLPTPISLMVVIAKRRITCHFLPSSNINAGKMWQEHQILKDINSGTIAAQKSSGPEIQIRANDVA